MYNYTVTQYDYIDPKAPVHIISGAAGNPLVGVVMHVRVRVRVLDARNRCFANQNTLIPCSPPQGCNEDDGACVNWIPGPRGPWSAYRTAGLVCSFVRNKGGSSREGDRAAGGW